MGHIMHLSDRGTNPFSLAEMALGASHQDAEMIERGVSVPLLL